MATEGLSDWQVLCQFLDLILNWAVPFKPTKKTGSEPEKLVLSREHLGTSEPEPEPEPELCLSENTNSEI